MGILLTVDSKCKICIIDNACVLFIMKKDHMTIINNVVSRINMAELLAMISTMVSGEYALLILRVHYTYFKKAELILPGCSPVVLDFFKSGANGKKGMQD